MNEMDPIELDGVDLPSTAYRLGVDGAGTTHYHDAFSSRIWLDDGETVTVRDLHGRDVTEWVAYVTAKRGAWQAREPVEETSGFAGLLEVVCRGLGA